MFKSLIENRKKTGIVVTMIVALLMVFAFSSAPSYFEVTKNLDIFTTLYKELNTYYVDTLQPEKLMNSGIHNMLESLDPYTDYIPEEDMDDYRTQTTGRYGGIGAAIATRGDYVVVTEPYENFPAAKAGMRAGDKIFEVNGKNAKHLGTDAVRSQLLGKPGTQLEVKVYRPDRDGKETELTIKLTREEIKIKNVPYFGVIAPGVGYILLNGFTERAGADVKNALLALQSKEKLKGIILDLRGNPGGLLPEAINVANVFVNKGVEIVSTRGRSEEWNKAYFTLNDAVDTKIPVIVLTDGGSASAAEIVSGALQDLDRAVIMGQKTFGKGLVQSTHSLPFNAKLKITTAKYYIPSGRCIQAINYAERNEDGSVKRVPDSLKTAFKTLFSKRAVYDGGGIDPDIAVETEKFSNIAFSLLSKNLIFDYATEYRAKHETIADAKSFTLTGSEYDAFVNWLSKKEYDYTTKSERLLEDLRASAEKEKYLDAIKDDFEAMKKTMIHDKQRDLEKEKEQIKTLLEGEIVARYYFGTGRVESSFDVDDELKEAVKLLNDESRVREILAKK